MSEKPLPFMETFSMNVISCSRYPPNHKHLPMEGCQFFQNPEGQAQVLSLVDCLCEFLSSILKILLQSYLEGLNNGSSITQKQGFESFLTQNRDNLSSHSMLKYLSKNLLRYQAQLVLAS